MKDELESIFLIKVLKDFFNQDFMFSAIFLLI